MLSGARGKRCTCHTLSSAQTATCATHARAHKHTHEHATKHVRSSAATREPRPGLRRKANPAKRKAGRGEHCGAGGGWGTEGRGHDTTRLIPERAICGVARGRPGKGTGEAALYCAQGCWCFLPRKTSAPYTRTKYGKNPAQTA